MDKELLFVYGTLRRGFANPVRNVLEEHASLASPASLRGKLYEIDGYPGVILSDDPDDLVYGEVYIITDRDVLFSILDNYEESSAHYPHPQEYERKKVWITLQNSENKKAWAYLYNWKLNGRVRIFSGDYLKYRAELG
jgi:gamma-glutamylcyclotransferase (GGCT)/AIG2-like uncharacterized protein YtfP